MLLIHRMERSWIWTAGFVVLVHALLLYMVSMHQTAVMSAKPRRPVHVQSVQLQPKASVNETAAVPPRTLPESTAEAVRPKPNPKPSTKKTVEPKVKPKKEAVKKELQPAPSSSPSVTKPKLSAEKIADARANLKKISYTTPVKGTSTPTQEVKTVSFTESSYEEALIERLQLLLTLPDYGKVTIKLTLDRLGHVTELVIVKAENEDNRRYAEQTLPELRLPPFGHTFAGEQSHTFQVVLSN